LAKDVVAAPTQGPLILMILLNNGSIDGLGNSHRGGGASATFGSFCIVRRPRQITVAAGWERRWLVATRTSALIMTIRRGAHVFGLRARTTRRPSSCQCDRRN